MCDVSNSNFWLVFTGTLFVYTGQRLYKIKTEDFSVQTERVKWMKANYQLVLFSLIASFIAFGYLAFWYVLSYASTIYLFLIAAILSVLYVVRIGKINLREVPFMKVAIVVSAYFILTVGLHLFQSRFPLEPSFIIAQVLLIASLTILFDIPDSKIDSTSLKTFAQMFGSNKTILLSLILMVGFHLILFQEDLTLGGIWSWIWLLTLVFFYAFLPKKVYSEFYLAIFGEAILGFWGFYFWISPVC